MLKLDAKSTNIYLKVKVAEFNNIDNILWKTRYGFILKNIHEEYYLMTKDEAKIFLSQFEGNDSQIET